MSSPLPAIAPAPASPKKTLAWWSWTVFLSVAIGLLVWENQIRSGRIEYLSKLPEWSVDDPPVDPASPTGYAAGARRLMVPNHNNESYQWIAETQQMMARGEWRVRRVDYENAPIGREVHSASPYRWWLGLLAWMDHTATGRPLGQAVERAAHWADPLLQLLLLLSATVFAARWFGAVSASAVALGLLALFPFGGSFLPGAPGQHGLVQFVAVWSLLPLLAGLRDLRQGKTDTSLEREQATRRSRRCFIWAGMFGGFGLWIDVASQVPLLAGVAIGSVVAAWIGRRDSMPAVPWRAWAYSGAAVSLLGYLLEYFPSHLTLQLGANHPLFALAWVGLGELLARGSERLQGKTSQSPRAAILRGILATLAIASLPLTLAYTHTRLFSQGAPAVLKLSLMSEVIAPSFSRWISRDGLNGVALATLAPLALAILGTLLVVLGRAGRYRATIGLALGPVVVAAILATRQLWWWNLVDATLLALLVVTVAALAETAKPALRWAGLALLAGLAIPGMLQLWPKSNGPDPTPLTDTEAQSYIERDLAHWLARQAGSEDALVLASPSLTTALHFFGGLRGLGTFNWENDRGTTAAVRMVSALSREEALALLTARGVTHLVLPSWDTYLDDYAALGLRASVNSEKFDQSFLGGLHHWDVPLWLRPVPYPLPAAAGQDRSVVIFQVVDEQDPPVAAGRMVEYFIEMQQLDRAAAAAQELQRFPGDAAALATLVQVQTALGDGPAAAATFNKLLPFVPRTARRPMPLDRRVSLAIVLAQQKRSELAKEQVERCLKELDEPQVRSLTTVSLYRFLLLCKLYNLPIGDPRLQSLARSLLRPDLRARL